MSNPITEFMKVSHSFLILMNSKIKRGEQNKTIAEEATTLEWYYKEMENLFTKFSDREHLHKLELFQERVKSKLLEKELILLIKASLTGNDEEVYKYITSTNFDTDEIDFSERVKFKKRQPVSKETFDRIKIKYNKGIKLKEILKHYSLNDEQLVDLVG